MTEVAPVHDWVYVLIVAIPAMCTLFGVIYQGRKTRRSTEEEAAATRQRGTEEHLLARDLLEAIQGDVKDVKADVRELKATDREHGERLEHLEHPNHNRRAGGRG